MPVAFRSGSAPSCRARSPRPRGLDLDDLRAHMRQLVAAERTRQHVGQVENTNAFKGFWHGVSFIGRRDRNVQDAAQPPDAFMSIYDTGTRRAKGDSGETQSCTVPSPRQPGLSGPDHGDDVFGLVPIPVRSLIIHLAGRLAWAGLRVWIGQPDARKRTSKWNHGAAESVDQTFHPSTIRAYWRAFFIQRRTMISLSTRHGHM
jgi:hypothetical protein